MKKPKRRTTIPTPIVAQVAAVVGKKKRAPRPGEGRPKGWKPKEHGANPGGAPRIWDGTKISDLGADLIAWAQEPFSFYLETFCKKWGTYPQRLSLAADADSKFFETLKVAKAAIASNLAEAATHERINTTMGVFGLKQHGWTDKHEHLGAGGGQLFPAKDPSKDEKKARAIAAKRVLDALGDV